MAFASVALTSTAFGAIVIVASIASMAAIGSHAAARRDVGCPGCLALDRRDAEGVDRRFGDHEAATPRPFQAEPEQTLSATRRRTFEHERTDFDVGDNVAGAVGESSAIACMGFVSVKRISSVAFSSSGHLSAVVE